MKGLTPITQPTGAGLADGNLPYTACTAEGLAAITQPSRVGEGLADGDLPYAACTAESFAAITQPSGAGEGLAALAAVGVDGRRLLVEHADERQVTQLDDQIGYRPEFIMTEQLWKK